MTAPDLKPCPFCGGEARKWQDPSHSAAWFIGCDDGDRDCFGSINWAETEAEAIAAWNRRATPAANDPKVKALVSREAATAREVFEDYGSKAKEAIDYMEQLLLAALPAVTVPLKQIGTGLYEQPAPGHVNEKPKTEHDAGNVLTPAPDAAAIREAVAKVRTKLADQDNATLLLGAEWALTMIEALTEKP